MSAVLFLLRAVVLVLLWGFVVAAIVAVRHDIFGTRATQKRPAAKRAPDRPATPPTPPAAAAKQPSRARRLVVVEGARQGQVVPLGDVAVSIGRADDSTLVLDDDYVSTRHARLTPRGDAWVLEDTGSTNGTYLDRQRVASPVPVPLRTPIRIGKTILELRP